MKTKNAVETIVNKVKYLITMNKNCYIIFLMFFLYSFNVFSQDLIVKNDNDSINCFIIRITNKNFYYNLKKDTTNYKIAVSEVKEYKYDYYKKNFSKKVLKDLTKEETGYNYEYLSLSLFAGKSFMVKVDNNMLMNNLDTISYYKKNLNSGYFFGGDVIYYTNNYLGLGLRIDYYFTSTQTNKFEYSHSYFDIDSVPRTETRIGHVSDNINMFFSEIFISGKYNFNQSYIYCNIGFSMINFKNKHLEIYKEYLRKGTSFGFGIDFGYEFRVVDNLALGLKLSYSAAKLKELSVNGNLKDLNKEKYINLSRYGISLSAKYWFQKNKK